MKTRILTAKTRELAGDDGVERPAPGAAPTAFRIWKAGKNETDYGAFLFSERSAKELLDEQAKRQNLYSFDVDHLSLSETAPPASRGAVGWHRLETRKGDGGPELWAVDVQWTETARKGLEADPPEWRYFSPAFDVDTKTNEVVSYLNTALTINPATWSVTALASRASSQQKGTRMDLKDIADAMGGDDEAKKAEAMGALKALAEKEEKDDAAAEGRPPEKPANEQGDTEGKVVKAAETETPAKDEKKDDEKDETTKAAIAATRDLAATVAAQGAELEALKADKIAQQRAEILASRKDLPASLVKTLSKMPISLMRETVASIPAPKEDAATVAANAARVSATRGQGQGGDSHGFRSARLPPEEHRELQTKMGTAAGVSTIRWDGNNRVFPILDRVEAKRVLDRIAAHKAEKAAAVSGRTK